MARAEVIDGGDVKEKEEVEKLAEEARVFIFSHVATNIHSDVSSALLRVSSVHGQ